MLTTLLQAWATLLGQYWDKAAVRGGERNSAEFLLCKAGGPLHSQTHGSTLQQSKNERRRQESSLVIRDRQGNVGFTHLHPITLCRLSQEPVVGGLSWLSGWVGGWARVKQQISLDVAAYCQDVDAICHSFHKNPEQWECWIYTIRESQIAILFFIECNRSSTISWGDSCW